MSGFSVLIINRVLPPDRGATGRCALDLGEALAAAGADVTLLACGNITAPGGAPQILAPKLRLVRTGRKLPDWPGRRGYMTALKDLWRKGLSLPRHDVVISMTDPPLLGMAGLAIARASGAVSLHWSQDVYPDLLGVVGHALPPGMAEFAERMARSTWRRHDHVVAIGDCMAQKLMQRGVAPERITVIRNRAPAALRPGAPGGAVFRSLHGLGSGPVALYAGTCGLAHPVETLVAAAGARPDWRMLVTAEGRGRSRAIEMATSRGLRNIHFLPHQPDLLVPSMMAAADIHMAAMANGAEGLLVPSKVQAAMAAGKPCLFLGPEGSDASRLIRRHGAGAVVDPGLTTSAERSLTGALDMLTPGTGAYQAACRGAVAAHAALGARSLDGLWMPLLESLVAAAPAWSGARA